MIGYLFIRFCTFPLLFLSYRSLHGLGRFFGHILFYLMPKFRKRALSNLALAKDLKLTPEEIQKIAKGSMQNLAITCLEYSKLSAINRIDDLVYCDNPEIAAPFIRGDTIQEGMRTGRGVIFFCGHQANWELLFLEGTSRMPGFAIGRPIKNRWLYHWLLSIREKFGGKILTPKNVIGEAMRALKRGNFLGIVGDQGMPDQDFKSLFLGRMAYTSPLPALLAYKMDLPLFAATIIRERNRYRIHYHGPFLPDTKEPKETEVPRLMSRVLFDLEESIRRHPDQWLWQHNRWKQQPPGRLKKEYRQDAIAIILPEEEALFELLAPQLKVFRTLYPTEWIGLYLPRLYQGHTALITDAEPIFYSSEGDLLQTDYRPKLLFNFSNYRHVERHFLKLSVFKTVNLDQLKKFSRIKDLHQITEMLTRVIYA